MVGAHRVVVLAAEEVAEAALVLVLTAAGDDGPGTHLVDLAGQPVAGGGVTGGAVGEDHEHHLVLGVGVREIGDAGLGGGQTRVDPEVADLRRVSGQQREGLDAHGRRGG